MAAIAAAALLAPFGYSIAVYLQAKVSGSDAGFERRLYEAVEHGEVFDMRDITPFEWDRMYVFGPYSTQDEMEKALGLEWTTRTWFGYWLDRAANIEHWLYVDESHNKLIFVRDQEIALDITLRRGKADFTQIIGVTDNMQTRFRAERNVLQRIDGAEKTR